VAAVVLGAWWINSKGHEDLARRRPLLLLVIAALSLALLALLIWTNPYGREISSSLPAFGVLPVSVVSVALILIKPGDFARLWATDRAILVALVLVIGVSSGFLWLAEPRTFTSLGLGSGLERGLVGRDTFRFSFAHVAQPA